MAASKFLHDTDTEEASSNGTWAANFDIDLKALNVIELRFFSALHWNLFVSKSDFNEFLMNRFAAVVHSDKAIRNKPKRHHPDSMVGGTSFADFNQKSRKIRPRWSLAKVRFRIESICHLPDSLYRVRMLHRTASTVKMVKMPLFQDMPTSNG